MKAVASVDEGSESPAEDSHTPETKVAACQAVRRMIGFFGVGGEYPDGHDPEQDARTLADAVARLR